MKVFMQPAGADTSLFAQVQTVLAGHAEVVVMDALVRSLVVLVGVSAADLESAQAFIDTLPGQMKPMLRAEWDSYRAHRAKGRLTDLVPSDSPLMRQAEASAAKQKKGHH